MRDPRPVKVRLEGLPEDIASLAEHLEATAWANIVDHSRPYPNRRGNPNRVRVYLEILIGPADDRSNTTVTELGPYPIAPPPP